MRLEIISVTGRIEPGDWEYPSWSDCDCWGQIGTHAVWQTTKKAVREF